MALGHLACGTILKMDDADLDELRMLRARAYGPTGDIADDPRALRRLRELEAAARETARDARRAADTTSPVGGATAASEATVRDDAPLAPHPGPPPPLPAGVPGVRLPAPTVIAVGGTVAASPTPPARFAPRRWFLSRGLAVLWVVSLIAVAALAAGMAFAAEWIAPIARHGEVRQIATLSPDPDFSWPEEFGALDTVMGFTFHGLTIGTTKTSLFTGTQTRSPCLIAFAAPVPGDTESLGRPFGGCGAGAFPATVQLVVDDTMPQDLRDVVPDGTALQFVLDGDRIGVFSDAR